MSTNSLIEWTDCTWNPVSGCSKVSPGCKNCYAEKTSQWLQRMGQANYRNGFHLTLQPQALHIPFGWKKPRRIFVNSMSDLFHEEIPLEFLQEVFAVMNKADRHIFQILTKRSERLLQLSPELPWTPNIWMGVSVENADYTLRIDDLRTTNPAIKFLSLEPLLGPITDLDLKDIDWVIVGGESGRSARPMRPEWVTNIRDQCVAAGVPFFFKQWGKVDNNPDPNDPTALGKGKAKGGRMLEDQIWNQLPSLNSGANSETGDRMSPGRIP